MSPRGADISAPPGLHGSSLTILSPATSTRSSATLVELEGGLENLLVDSFTDAYFPSPDLHDDISPVHSAAVVAFNKSLSSDIRRQDDSGFALWGWA